MRKIVCRQLKEALLCNGGIAESGLQMPHVHILPVTPLGACDMAQAGADEHQGCLLYTSFTSRVHILAHDASTKKHLGFTKIGKVIVGNREMCIRDRRVWYTE